MTRVTRPTRRAGFTLVELIVVLGIAAILVAMIAAASIQIIASQRASATESAMKTIDDALKGHWRSVVDSARKETVPNNVLSLAGGDARRAQIIWVKLRLKQEFPMNFTEALAPWDVPAAVKAKFSGTPITSFDLPSRFQIMLTQAGVTSGSQVASFDQNGWPMESAVCLYLALSRAHGTAGTSVDSLPITSVAAVPGSPVLKMLVDAWGKPLSFYRWPMTAEVDAMCPGGATARLRDPLDPEGLLMDPIWNNVGNWGSASPGGVWWFEIYCHPLHSGGPPAAPATYKPMSFYSVPSFASAGKNGGIGLLPFGMYLPQLNPPQQPASPLFPDTMQPDPTTDASNDNLYSHRLRGGTRGD